MCMHGNTKPEKEGERDIACVRLKLAFLCVGEHKNQREREREGEKELKHGMRKAVTGLCVHRGHKASETGEKESQHGMHEEHRAGNCVETACRVFLESGFSCSNTCLPLTKLSKPNICCARG